MDALLNSVDARLQRVESDLSAVKADVSAVRANYATKTWILGNTILVLLGLGGVAWSIIYFFAQPILSELLKLGAGAN
jgi:hypothetical protein